jgi:UDP-N-acetylglucosamine transferase subunit ALG13
MIFVTVGMEKFPFNRFIKSLDDAVINHKIKGEVFAQIGNSLYKPRALRYKRIISFNEMKDNISKSDIVISHAGAGSYILSLSLNKMPIIFPRRYDLGEHLDNHQIEFARRMEAVGKAIVAYDTHELIEKINNYHSILASLKPSLDDSKNRLVAYLEGIICKK